MADSKSSSIKVTRSKRTVSPVARASYPTLFVPRAFEDGEPKFGISLLLNKSDPTTDQFLDDLRALQDTAAKELYPKKIPTAFERHGIVDGDDLEDETQHGNWVVRARAKMKPAVVDADKAEILDKDVIYGGCYVRGSICAKAYGTPAKGGVSLEIVAVQFVRDGEPFSAAMRARSEAATEFSDDIPF